MLLIAFSSTDKFGCIVVFLMYEYLLNNMYKVLLCSLCFCLTGTTKGLVLLRAKYMPSVFTIQALIIELNQDRSARGSTG